MKTNFTLKSSLMVLFLCLGLSSWGQETLTINRSSFPSGFNYTNSTWTATASTGEIITGQSNLYLNTTTHMQIGGTQLPHPYNSVEIPGAITKIQITMPGSGSLRQWIPRVSENEVLTSASGGTSLTSQTFTSNTETLTWNLNASDNYKFFYLQAGGNTNIASITIEYEVAPAVPTITTDLTSLNMNTTFGTSVTSDLVVTGALLTSDISVAVAGDGFSVNPTTLGNTGGTLTVTYNPATVGTHTGSITLSSTGAEDVIINLNGTATLAVPVATAATFTGATSFVANWNAVAGAESYEIDVYTVEEQNGGFATDLFISEYVEGSSNNKAIEIYNGTGSTIDLSSYSLKKQVNGAGDYVNNLFLSGNLVHGQVYILANSSASNDILTKANQTSGGAPLDFNGNDAVALFKNDIQIDEVGVFNQTSNWGENVTLRRKSDVSEPNPTYTVSEWNTFPIDTFEGLGSHDFVGGISSVITYILQEQNVGNVTSYSVTGLDPETTYYYVVRAVANNIPSGDSNEIEVTTTSAVVWTASDIWSNGTGPNAEGSDNVVIEGDLILTPSDDYSVNNLEVNGILIIEDGAFIEVGGMIINNAGEEYFVIEKGGNLVQHNETPNTGAITVEVVSQTEWFGYNMFSSPVAGQTFTGFSGNINGEEGLEVYTYYYGGPADNEHYYQSVTGSFAQGLGYLFAAPYSPDNYPQGELSDFASEFSGVPNNGTVSVAVGQASYKAFGNPYPSAINTHLFFTENTHVEALYFWTNAHFYQPSPISEYLGNNYAVRNYLAGTGTSADFPDPGATIEVGQGFLAWVSNANSVTFSNSMRETSSDGVFYRVMQPEKHILWLNLSNENNTLHQIAIGYASGATEGVDSQMDAEMFGYGGSALYSLIADQESAYVIQGRSLPFADTDVVPLGFRATKAGSYTISLADFNGMFAEGQDIYIKDHLTETTHNLKEADYSFVSEIGVFEDRFEVVYLPSGDLNVTHPQYQNKWVVYSQDNGFRIETQGFELQEVKVYDVLGRLVYNQQAEGTHHSIQNIIDGVLIIKVTTTENQTLTKKIAK